MNAITSPRITAPGIYDIDSDTYHADPCPAPSLSAGMINDLLKAPAKCREASRRLNPNWEQPDHQEKFTIGTVSHVIFLEPELFEAKVLVCPFDDWKKNVAKDMRKDARAAGRTAILEKHMAEVLAARSAFVANPFVNRAFTGGRAEASLFWRHPVHGFWCRARPDYITNSMADYKATQNANPADFGRHAYNLGYHRRAAWYLEGHKIITGAEADHYWFCNQETKAPYLPSVVELDWQAIEAGHAENEYAADLFAKCLATGDWFGYRDREHLNADRAFQVGLPTYAYMQIDARLGRDDRQWPAPKKIPQEEEVE